MKRAIVVLAACSSAPSTAKKPDSPPPADAAVDAAPDAGVSEAVLAAPAWVFRYSTAQRKETWTLRHNGGEALVTVETAQATQRYLGTATQGASLVVDVSTGTAKLTLDCKNAKRAVGTKCNDAKAKKLDVLDCYHPDFKEPMPFGPAPGIEYQVDASCNGYRLVAP